MPPSSEMLFWFDNHCLWRKLYWRILSNHYFYFWMNFVPKHFSFLVQLLRNNFPHYDLRKKNLTFLWRTRWDWSLGTSLYEHICWDTFLQSRKIHKLILHCILQSHWSRHPTSLPSYWREMCKKHEKRNASAVTPSSATSKLFSQCTFWSFLLKWHPTCCQKDIKCKAPCKAETAAMPFGFV